MKKLPGFTLVEIIIVMGIMALLLGLVVINLTSPIHRVSLTSAVNLLTADIEQQQIKAMSGNNAGASIASPSGILFNQYSYVVFTGQSYRSSDPNNFTVKLDPGLKFTSSLPGNTLKFASVSGEVVGFSLGNDTVTLSRTDLTESKVIKFNSYGIITSVN